MSNINSFAPQAAAEWRSCQNPVRDKLSVYEQQPFRRPRARFAVRAAEPTVTQASAGTLGDPVYLAQLRRDLVRFARLQLRDAAAAEDAVQEALAAAWTQATSLAHPLTGAPLVGEKRQVHEARTLFSFFAIVDFCLSQDARPARPTPTNPRVGDRVCPISIRLRRKLRQNGARARTPCETTSPFMSNNHSDDRAHASRSVQRSLP